MTPLLTGENGVDTVRQALAGVSVDRIRRHIRALKGVRHPLAAPEALDRAADYIGSSLRSLGLEMTEHRFAEDGREFRNVIATRRGTRYSEQRVVVLAHYDTVADSPGADDNASGVAVLLELATILSPCQFERCVQFIGVNLEENAREGDHWSGTRGSRALAEHARENGWAIEGVVVLESVAYAGDAVVQTARTRRRSCTASDGEGSDHNNRYRLIQYFQSGVTLLRWLLTANVSIAG